jgi:hypothetical protein
MCKTNTRLELYLSIFFFFAIVELFIIANQIKIQVNYLSFLLINKAYSTKKDIVE